jgi:mannosyltransferase
MDLKSKSIASSTNFPLLIVFFISCIARFYYLGNLGIWADEGYTAYISKKGLFKIVELLKFDSAPPLYYLVVSPFLKIIDNELFLRLPSAIAGCLTVILIFIVGRKLVDKKTGFYAAFVLGLSPLHIYYSQEARNYSLLALFSVCAFYFFIRIKDRNLVLNYIAYSLFCLCVLYTHNLGLFFYLAILISGFLYGYFNKPYLKGWLISNFIILILYIPWLQTFILQVGISNRTVGWIQYIWMDKVYYLAIPLSLFAFMIGGKIPGHVGIYTVEDYVYWSLILHVFVAIFLILYLINRASKEERKKVLLISAILILPLFFMWISSFKIPVYLPGRTDMGVFPFFALLVGYAISRIRWSSIRVVILFVLLFFSMRTIGIYYYNQDRLKDQRFSQLVSNFAHDDDIVLFTGLTIPSMTFYLDRCQKNLHYIFFPSEMEQHLGHYDPEPIMKNNDLLQQEIMKVINYLRENLNSEKRVWLIYEDHQINLELFQSIRNEFTTCFSSDYVWNLFLLNRPLRLYAFKK